MQGTEHQVAGFGGGQRQPDGFLIAHLAHQNDVRVLAQRRTQRLVEPQRIAMHLALIDQTALTLVYEFNRILDGQDMAILVLVDMINHRRQGGGLARTGRTGDQDQAARHINEIPKHRRTSQIIQGLNDGRNGAEHARRPPVLIKGVDAEPGQLGNLEREVAFQKFIIVLALLIVHDVIDQTMHLLVFQRRHVDAAHVAVYPDHRRQAG